MNLPPHIPGEDLFNPPTRTGAVISPITKVDQIRTPLLVIQGADDAHVVHAESDNLVNTLRARDVNPENVIERRAMARFLGKQLGGRV